MIEWNEKYSVGISMIDEEHKKFIDIINNAIVTKEYSDNPEEIRKVLLEMINYALNHFENEELNMIKFNFPEYQSHRNEHLDFTDKMVAITNIIIKGDNKVANQILENLKQWFVNHIQSTDRKYISCFIKNGLK